MWQPLMLSYLAVVLAVWAGAAVPAPPVPQTGPAPIGGSPIQQSFPEGLPLVTIDSALLDRYDIQQDRYLALAPAEKAQLQRDLTLAEAGRLHKLAMIKRVTKETWPKYVTAKGWLTPEGLRLIEEYERRLRDSGLMVPVNVALERKDGKPLTDADLSRARVVLDSMFDGLEARGDLVRPGEELVWDAQFRNETLHHVSVTNARGLTFEVGQLGVDGKTAIIAPSWYGNLTKRWESDPAAWVDYRVHAQVGYVDMRSRLFADDNVPDPRIERAVELAGKLGVPRDKLSQIRSNLDYDDAYKAHGLIVASLLTELGRAYNLFGPVDIAWTAANLTKIMHLAPNTAFDETAGLRVKLSDQGPFLGVFGGFTENISPVGNRLLQEAFMNDTVKAGFNLETAPHATVALWGKVPGLSDTAFKLAGTRRWNRDTRADEAEAAVMTTFQGRPLTLRGVVSRENGDAIEFDRRKVRAQLEYQLSDQAQAYLAYEREKIKYGNADVDSDMFLAGFQMNFGGSRHTLRADHLWANVRESSPLYPHLTETLGVINRDLAAGIDAAERAAELYRRLMTEVAAGQLAPSLDALSQSLGRLSPESLAQLLDQLDRAHLSPEQKAALSQIILRTVTPGSSYDARLRRLLAGQAGAPSIPKGVADVTAYVRDHKAEMLELAGLLSDPRVWDAVAVRAGRAALVTALAKSGKVSIPLLGHEMKLLIDAPVILAACNILQSRLSPLAPVKKSDVDPWLLRMAGQSLGLENATEDAIMGKLFAMADEELKRSLNKALAPQIDALLAQQVYDRGKIATAILTGLPPAAADALRRRYGADLAGLLPPAGSSPAQIREFLVTRLTAEVLDFLHKEYGPDLAKALAAMTSWAGDIMRREINMTLIQLMLASEELDRLSVDRGRKAGDLSIQMLMSSFDKLDTRSRPKLTQRIEEATRDLAEETGLEEKRLADKLTAYGKSRLETLTLSPAWPQGLKVTVADSDWPQLLTNYSDSSFFAFVSRLAGAYKPKPKGAATLVEIAYGSRFSGTSIDKHGDGLKYSLTAARDFKEAEFKLSGLESYLDDK